MIFQCNTKANNNNNTNARKYFSDIKKWSTWGPAPPHLEKQNHYEKPSSPVAKEIDRS